MIHDDVRRENEVDYVVWAGRVDTDIIYEMRTLAGGLICYAMPLSVAKGLGLRFFDEILKNDPTLARLVKLPGYGDRPAFSIWVNHVSVKTGIRDEDRAITIRELHRVTSLFIKGDTSRAKEKFYTEFMAPGHVPILVGRSISERRGHTELSLHLAALAELTPSIALVEMLKRGGAVSFEEALRISREYGYPLVSAADIVKAVKKNYKLICKYMLCN